MLFKSKPVKVLAFLLFCLSLSGCGSSDDNNTDGPVQEAFSVTTSSTEFTLDILQSTALSYEVSRQGDTQFPVNVVVSNEPETGSVSINTDTQSIVYSAPEAATSGSFTLNFASATSTQQVTINYTVTELSAPICDSDCPVTETPEYIINFPTDYVTVFEDEEITIELKRNYEMSEDVLEEFFFNTSNISGRLSADKSSLIIRASQGEEDTYGEIKAVTRANGVIHESTMYLLYYNKNRDHSSLQTPVVAVANPTITVPQYGSTSINFDIYDGDSDRLSYRIVSAPFWTQSHINRVTAGYDLTVYAVNPVNTEDNQLVLEVSDGHNSSQLTFTIEVTNTDTPINHRPELFIEQNVTVSLLQEMTGLAADETTQFAFAYNELDGEYVDLSFTSSSDLYSFRLAYPYIYVTKNSDDQIQHDQLTISANDGLYRSKLTFHLYTRNNFTEFLGGNENLAPLIDSAEEITVLETKNAVLPFTTSDFEGHQYTTRITFDDNYIQAIQIGNTISIDALLLEEDEDVVTQLIIWAEDEFGARRERQIDVTVAKNALPVISFDIEQINLVEGFGTEFELTVTDADQGPLEPTFEFNQNLLVVEYDTPTLNIRALEISADFSGELTISATDEFDATTTVNIPVTIGNVDPFNQPPSLTIDQTSIESNPGDTTNLIVTVSDPEGDTLSTTITSNNSLLTYVYNNTTGQLAVTVDASSPWQQEFQLLVVVEETTSFGTRTVEQIITVTVPEQPVPPVITVGSYRSSIDEEEDDFIINFQIFDENGGQVVVTTNNVDPAITINQFDDYLEVTAPDNVLVTTNYSFLLVATDDTNLTSSELIQFAVQPVNDAPAIYLPENNITLENDDPYNLLFTISDPDSSSHTIELRDINGNALPAAFTFNSSNIAISGTANVYDARVTLSGASKGTIVNNQQLVLRVYDPASGNNIFVDTTFTASIILVNDAPTVTISGQNTSLVQTQMLENQQQVINLQTNDVDGDSVTISNVTSDDEASLTIGNIDTSNLPQFTIRLDSTEVTSNTDVTVEIEFTDGFETVTQQIQVEVLDSP